MHFNLKCYILFLTSYYKSNFILYIQITFTNYISITFNLNIINNAISTSYVSIEFLFINLMKFNFYLFNVRTNLQLAFEKENIEIAQLLIQHMIFNDAFKYQNIDLVQRILLNYGVNIKINKENYDIIISLFGDLLKSMV